MRPYIELYTTTGDRIVIFEDAIEAIRAVDVLDGKVEIWVNGHHFSVNHTIDEILQMM